MSPRYPMVIKEALHLENPRATMPNGVDLNDPEGTFKPNALH